MHSKQTMFVWERLWCVHGGKAAFLVQLSAKESFQLLLTTHYRYVKGYHAHVYDIATAFDVDEPSTCYLPGFAPGTPQLGPRRMCAKFPAQRRPWWDFR